MTYSRRNFLTNSAAVACGALLSAGLESCSIGHLFYSSGDIPVIEGMPILVLSTEPLLQQIGGAVKKRYSALNDGDVILIVRISEKEFTAFAAQCTHWGAEVDKPVGGVLVCPFHGSRFNAIDGSVIEGPASEPLRKFVVDFDESKQQLLIKDL